MIHLLYKPAFMSDFLPPGRPGFDPRPGQIRRNFHRLLHLAPNVKSSKSLESDKKSFYMVCDFGDEAQLSKGTGTAVLYKPAFMIFYGDEVTMSKKGNFKNKKDCSFFLRYLRKWSFLTLCL